MRGRFERRAMVRGGLAIGLVALAVFVVLPVFADEPVDAVHLHTAPNGATAFTYDGVPPQPVVNGKGCLIKDPAAGSLVGLGSTAGRSRPGFIRGIGLKTGGANGTPCSQVDQDDAGSLVLTSANRVPWGSMTLDLELKQNAWIEISVSGGGHGSETEIFTLLSGASIDPLLDDPTSSFPYTASVSSSIPRVNCANPSDSGPDSGPNDNCRLTVTPDTSFTTVTITALVGAVSLEGGADFVDFAGYEDGAWDSIFVYAPVTAVDDDSFITDEDTPVSGNVLTNDIGVGVLTATELVGPESGTVSLLADGSFTYSPDLNFNGQDSFTYRASNGPSADTATVTITVNPVNDAPNALSPTKQVDEDGSLTIPVGELGTDVDDETLTVTILSDPGSGTAVINESGGVDYAPEPNFFGTDSFSYQVCDLTLCSETTATVTVQVAAVNDAPIAEADAHDVDENHTTQSSKLVVVAPGVLGNDSDVDSLDLMASKASDPSHGSVSVSSDGSFEYTPDVGYVGSDSFSYRAFDGALYSELATVTIEVVEVMCTGEPQSDLDGAVFGEFTLLTAETCKRYWVDADEASETVTFTPEGEEDATFRGVLRFPAETVVPTLNSLSLLEYDPDGDGLDFVTMPVCESPVFDGGNVVSATIPGYPNQTWCLVSVTATANGDGDLAPTYIVYGEGDPIFRVK